MTGARRLAAGLALLLASRAAGAQVGHLPERSPYRDAPFRQGVSVFSGWWSAGRNPAGVAPNSAPLIGARYDWSVGEAGSLYVRQQVVFASRTPVDPFRAPSQRSLGSYSWPFTAFDAGFTLNMTGQKSRKGLIPVVSLGVGFVSDLILATDVGGYSFGTSLAVTPTVGMHYVVNSKYRVRVEVGNFMHRFRHPDTYYSTTYGDAILTRNGDRNGWRHNITTTLGLTLITFR
ncbi:MAG: hypothetical protein SFW08_13210 [Gemmatimonadaceae bacterium]|nr:hypothetical protein [Gemmatimonadaceae bacterium]